MHMHKRLMCTQEQHQAIARAEAQASATASKVSELEAQFGRIHATQI